jgi:hypothetical protein
MEHTVQLTFYAKGNRLGTTTAYHVPRVGDEMAVIPSEAKRAFMYRVIRVSRDFDLREGQRVPYRLDEVDVFLEQV